MEIICDRVAFIKHGEVLRVTSINGLIHGETTVTIHAPAHSAQTLLDLRQWGDEIRSEGENIVMSVQDEESLPAITRYLVESGIAVYSLVPRHLSLEELFIQVVGTDGGL